MKSKSIYTSFESVLCLESVFITEKPTPSFFDFGATVQFFYSLGHHAMIYNECTQCYVDATHWYVRYVTSYGFLVEQESSRKRSREKRESMLRALAQSEAAKSTDKETKCEETKQTAITGNVKVLPKRSATKKPK